MSDAPEDSSDDGLPDAHWGTATTPLPDWREDSTDDFDPDDEELPQTPPDVIAMLGFDPLDLDDDEPEAGEDADPPFAADAEWEEAAHKRGQPGNAGQFGSGGGSKPAKPAKAAPKPDKPSAPVAPTAKPAGKPLTLIQAAEHKTPDETWHHEQSFQHADAAILAAIHKTPKLTRVNTVPSGLGCYQSDSCEITMPAGREDNDEQALWRHEFGHAIDFNGSLHSASVKAEPARKKEARLLVARLREEKGPDNIIPPGMIARRKWIAEQMASKDVSAEEVLAHCAGSPFRAEAVANVISGADRRIPNLVKVARAQNKDGIVQGIRSDEVMYMDFLGAMTNNRFGYGHPTEYYEHASYRRTAEMFANYVSLTAGPSGAVYRAILHAIAPDCCAMFDKIITAAGNDDRGPWLQKGDGNG
jgi:hypothetical protein